MNKTRFLISLWLMLLVFGGLDLSAQVSFAKDKFYLLSPAGKSEQVIAYEAGQVTPKLVKQRNKQKVQQWSITGLSGSFRFMNPFDNLALHARTDNQLGVTENNGSDESQLWTVTRKGDFYQITPTNTPKLMLACTGQGELVLLPKRKVAEQPETLFRIELSRMKAPLSMLFDLANRPRTYWEDKPVLKKTKKRDMLLICLIRRKWR